MLVEAVGIGLKARLKLRKLLILRTGKMAKTAEIAEATYTPGTRDESEPGTPECRPYNSGSY